MGVKWKLESLPPPPRKNWNGVPGSQARWSLLRTCTYGLVRSLRPKICQTKLLPYIQKLFYIKFTVLVSTDNLHRFLKQEHKALRMPWLVPISKHVNFPYFMCWLHRNLIKSNRNQIVLTILRLIWNSNRTVSVCCSKSIGKW